jgi:hypothetical protein
VLDLPSRFRLGLLAMSLSVVVGASRFCSLDMMNETADVREEQCGVSNLHFCNA